MRQKTHVGSRLTGANLVFFAAVLAFGTAGCSKQAPTNTQGQVPAQSQTQAQAQVQHYQLKGTVISMDAANKSLEVNMEAIPGYMGAMPMSFPVHDSSALAGLHPGNFITADLVVTSDGTYLENVQVAKKDSGEKRK
jgi:Cu/Ag efflux protein CusF